MKPSLISSSIPPYAFFSSSLPHRVSVWSRAAIGVGVEVCVGGDCGDCS